MRPFGSSFLYIGWDKVYGYQLYQSDPSGNYGGWKATCIGGNYATAQSMFKTDYQDNTTLEQAKRLAFKILAKTVESSGLSADKRTIDRFIPTLVELVTLQRRDDKTEIKFLPSAEIEALAKEASQGAGSSTASSRQMQD